MLGSQAGLLMGACSPYHLLRPAGGSSSGQCRNPRSGGHQVPSSARRLQGPLTEVLIRICLRMADVRLFTSKAYLQELMPPGTPQAYVTPATWVDEEWILSEEEAREAWAAKRGPVRMLFASRLIRRRASLCYFPR